MAFLICARCGEAMTKDGKDLWGGFRCSDWQGNDPIKGKFVPLHSSDPARVSTDDDTYNIREET